MITLYYVPGISAVDEPVFDTLANQELFFDNYKNTTLIDGFYPPHYTNEIILGNDYLEIIDAVNYLSLDFNNRTFYYFIDNVEYISEDAVKLYVTMDTIQTYMFDINFLQSDVNRMSIKRWTSTGKINRNYIRSNRSKGTMEQRSLLYTPRTIGWYVIITNSPATLYYDDGNGKSPYTERMCTLVSSPLGTAIGNGTPVVNIIAIPVLLISNYKYLEYGGRTHYLFDDLVRIHMLGCINGIESITYYDYNIFKDYCSLTYDESTHSIAIASTHDDFLSIHFYNLVNADARRYYNLVDNDGYADLGYMFVPRSHLQIPYFYTTISIPFYQMSKSKYNSFSSSRIPAMLDENYVQVEFGERLGYTTYPLHYITDSSASLYGVSIINYADGGRSYYITDDVLVDKYFTLITNASIEQVALYNDAWQTYLSQNLCTLMRGRALVYQQIGYKSVMGSLASYDGDPRLVTANYELPYKIHKKYTKYAYDATVSSTTTSYNTDLAGRFAAMGGNISLQASLYNQSREINEANIEAQPDAQKIGNSCASDCTTGVLRVYSKIYYCSDYEDVAKDYEQNGYDVALHTSDNLFQLGSRYYYNVIRANNVELTLSNAINDSATIMSIKDRFKAGLRFWNTTNGKLNATRISAYTLDNVETDFIS